jgi:uncharacterized protein involved in exopolysaccharide biosynthesis
MDRAHISTSSQSNDQSEIGLTDLIFFVWGARWVILIGAVLGIGSSILFLGITTYRYTATLIVTPTKTEMAQLPGNMSGLAAIAGFSLPGAGGVNDFNLYLVAMQSRQVAAELAKDQKIMQRLFASQYDIPTKKWRRRSDFVADFSLTSKLLLRVPGADWRQPDGADLQKFIQENVKVSSDRKSNITNLSVDHEDPEFAARLITDLHEKTDAVLRRRALARADQAIEYLEKQLSHVQLAEHRQALAAILGEQEKSRMLASSAAPYAAQPFGAAVVSSRPTSPQPIIVLVVGLVGGMITSMVMMLGWRISQSARRKVGMFVKY